MKVNYLLSIRKSISVQLKLMEQRLATKKVEDFSFLFNLFCCLFFKRTRPFFSPPDTAPGGERLQEPFALHPRNLQAGNGKHPNLLRS